MLTNGPRGVILLIEFESDATLPGGGDPTSSTSTQGDGHHSVHIGQENGDADSCNMEKLGQHCSSSPLYVMLILTFHSNITYIKCKVINKKYNCTNTCSAKSSI